MVVEGAIMQMAVNAISNVKEVASHSSTSMSRNRRNANASQPKLYKLPTIICAGSALALNEDYNLDTFLLKLNPQTNKKETSHTQRGSILLSRSKSFFEGLR